MAASVCRLRPDGRPAVSRKQTSRRKHRLRSRQPPPVLAFFSSLPLAVLVRGASAASSSPSVYPYVPTSLLVASNGSSTALNASVVYIFTTDDSGRVDLLSLNVSATSSTSDLKTITEGVPFLADDGQASTTTAFVPFLQLDGSILVMAGDCASSGNTSSMAWTIAPADASSSWTSTNITQSDSLDVSVPWFLGGSVAFSSQILPTQSDPIFYVYGGMCPDSASSTSADWQANATYTNDMLRMVNRSTSSSSSPVFSAAAVSDKGPPVAEAGFSMTPLSASLTNHSSGVVTQEISSVLLGGHTSAAFVNMSTAAVWSLPEAAWSYVTISTNTSSTSSAPDSRSGHTAVMNEDGNAIIVLGGWVGDMSQAADPQLVVLELGTGYGDWQWTVPSGQPSTAMYGHGAALLPGNVMMVYGGYNISDDSSGSGSGTSSKLIRRDSSSLSFLNLTSLAWTQDYTNPSYQSISASSSSSSSSSSQSSTKIGLGVGLGVGLALLFCGLFFCCRVCWRRRQKRKQRNDTVKALAQDGTIFIAGHDEVLDVGEHANLPSHWRANYMGGHDPYHYVGTGVDGVDGGRRSLGYESLRGYRRSHDYLESGMLGDGDSDMAYSENITYGDYSSIAHKPTRQTARGLYQPTTIADYEQANSIAAGSSTAAGGAAAAAAVGASGIHPIYEADEEEEGLATGPDRRSRVSGVSGATGPVVPMLPPNTSSGRSVSPETAESGETAETVSLMDPFATPVVAARGEFGTPNSRHTVQLDPFVHDTPSPNVSKSVGSGNASTSGGGPTPVGQDRDVQEWVAGLEIEDLLFAPPVAGAAAAVASSVSPAPSAILPLQQRGRLSPVRPVSNQSRSNNSSPTRGSFFGAAVAAAGVAGWGLSDDEARTGSNLSDRSAFSFMTRSASSLSRMGAPYMPLSREETAGRGGSSSGVSDTTGQSYSTAMTGFHALRTEGPNLLYGKAGPSGGGGGGGSLRVPGGPSAGLTLAPPPPTFAPAPSPGPNEYGGAAAVLRPDMLAAQQQQGGYAEPISQAPDDENTALTGSPSKSRRRRSVLGNFFRMFSGNVPPAYAATASDEPAMISGSSSAQPPMVDIRDRAHATLLRRKQGRSDWEADDRRDEENTAVGGLMGRSMGTMAMVSAGEASTATAKAKTKTKTSGSGSVPATSGVPASGSVAAGRRDGSGKSEDWDVENAAQMRSVQVMFTVPRSVQLRVVNAEVVADVDDDDEKSKNKPSEAAALGPLRLVQSPEEMRKIQEAQLRDMEETLAESRRILAESQLPSWVLEELEKEDREKEEAQKAGEGSSEVKETKEAKEAKEGGQPATGSRKGKEAEGRRLQDDMQFVNPEDVPKPLQPLRSNPPNLQTLRPRMSAPLLEPPKTPPPSKTLQARKSASSLHSTLAPPSPATPGTAAAAKRKSGFVLDMVEQIESSSSAGSRPSSRAASPVKGMRD